MSGILNHYHNEAFILYPNVSVGTLSLKELRLLNINGYIQQIFNTQVLP